MAKRTKSAAEMRMAWISEDIWFEMRERGKKLRGLSLRGGLGDWLIVIKIYEDDKPYVAFVGGATLEKAIGKLHQALLEGGMKWRPDEYEK